MGTRFIASQEARANEGYKKRITEISSADTAVTRSYSGKPMRVVRNAWVDDWERRPERDQALPGADVVRRARGRAAVRDRRGRGLRAERACMPCGQGAGGITDIPTCAEIIDRVMRDASATIARLQTLA
jgi:enoyl-[acyl-carrier protein] reductase II